MTSRRFNAWLTGALWILTGGLFQVYWYWVASGQVASELGRPSGRRVPMAVLMVVAWVVAVLLLVASGNGQLEAIGLTLVPLAWAYPMYGVWKGIDELRDKVGAPRFPALSYALALTVPFLMLYVFHYVLKGLTLDIYTDARAVFDATGYGFLLAWPWTFAFGVGYLNEYWIEREGSLDFTSIAEDLS
jgi:hypothetical protein